MNKMRQVQNDEINLFELFQTLWDGKWLISAFVAIAGLIGCGLILLKDTVFESKLIYSIDTIPPFYEADKVSSDFKEKFYSVSVFDEWKKNNSNKSLVFADFNVTEVVDGFVMTKSEDELLAKFETENNGSSFMLIKSNQLPILESFFNYSNHINELVRNDYITLAKEELNLIESRFKDYAPTDSDFAELIISFDRYIFSAEKGANVLLLQRPTMPKKVSPKAFQILVISLVLGGMIGVFFTLLRNAITK